MHESVLNSGWETFLYGVPVIFMLVVGVFRLDELIAAPKRGPRAQRLAVSVDENGKQMLCDPDGRPFGRRSTRK